MRRIFPSSPPEGASPSEGLIASENADRAPDAAPAKSPPERGYAEIHRDAFVMDAHCDTLLRVVDDGTDLRVRSEEGHIDLPRLSEGGVDAQVFAVWVAEEYLPKRARARADEMIDAFHQTVESAPDLVGHARTAREARALTKEGKIAAFLGLEGGYAIEDDPSNLAHFFDRGVRYMTLTWWHNTGWADGSGDKPRFHGLSELGERVVREMNRLGMLVDVSHVSDETFEDVLRVSEDPVIASHSNARALADHHRNLSDDMLRALAKNGGVVGVNYVAGFLDEEFAARSERLRGKLKPRFEAIEKRLGKGSRAARKERWALFKREAAKLPPVHLAKVVDHIDHIVRVAGGDHVGLGSDFDGFGAGPRELEDATAVPLITRELVARGYGEDDIRKILGGNFLRVFEAVIDN